MPVNCNVTPAVRALQQFRRDYRKAERQGMRRGAKILQRAVKEQVPIDEGDLYRSIKVRAGRRSRKGQSVNVVSDLPYAKKIDDLYGYRSIAIADSEREIINELQGFVDSLVREFNRG